MRTQGNRRDGARRALSRIVSAVQVVIMAACATSQPVVRQALDGPSAAPQRVATLMLNCVRDSHFEVLVDGLDHHREPKCKAFVGTKSNPLHILLSPGTHTLTFVGKASGASDPPDPRYWLSKRVCLGKLVPVRPVELTFRAEAGATYVLRRPFRILDPLGSNYIVTVERVADELTVAQVSIEWACQ
jgi:hypothetical protein